MITFRDRYHDGAHVVVLEQIEIVFGDDGVLRNPSAEQLAALERDGTNRERFPRRDEPDSGAERVEEASAPNDAGVVEEVGSGPAREQGSSAPDSDASTSRRGRGGRKETE